MASDKKRNHTKVNIICIFLGMILVLFVISKRELISQALFDSNQAVQIDPDLIEDSTLIIGTHLIYLHSLNDELYQIAQQSASDSGQDRIYYKSEMADGIWYDITDAGSIRDITSDGDIVENDVLQQLFFTHHTKSDGITYDLRTNQAVCIFDIYPIYDLENMPELESLKLQYDMMKEAESATDTSKRNLNLSQQFFATKVNTAEADSYGQQIDALQSYYQELMANDASITETESVLNIMGKLDYARKTSVFSIVDTALSNLQDAVSDTKSPEDDEDIKYDMDDALLTAIGNAQSAISESETEAQGNMLSEGDTVLTGTEYSLAQNLISAAQAHNYTACDEANGKLIDLKHITEGMIASPNTELTLVEEMIATADQKYQTSLSIGESTSYQAKAAENASHAALNNILKQDLTTVNAARSELQFLIQSKTDRQENELAQSFILIRIQESSLFLRIIPNDAYMSAMKGTVDSYVTWLQELLAKVKGNSSTQTKTESLYEEKASLQEQYLEALDDLNLDTAKKLEAQIQAKADEITSIEAGAENSLTSLLNQKNALEKELEDHPTDENLKQELATLNAQIANVGTDMADGSAAANILDMKNQALSYIEAGDTSNSAMDSLKTCIDGLSSMLDGGSTLALSSMKELYQQMVSNSYLTDTNAYDDMIKNMENTLEQTSVVEALDQNLSPSEALTVLGDALGVDLTKNSLTGGNASGTATGAGTSTEGKDSNNGTTTSDNTTTSGNDTETTDAQTSGDNTVTDEDIAAALVALAEYTEETGNEEIQALLEGQVLNAAEQGKGYMFKSYKSNQESFVPAETLAKYIGYRYLWNDTKKTAILSRGPVFYRFQTFYEDVEREDGNVEYMDTQAAYAGKIYLPQSYISKQFDCQVIDISGTEYSVLVNDTVIEKSQELCSGLLEKGGN